MDVILLERIEKLGRMGDVVSVKTGYARNFLLPRGKALRATDANRRLFEARRSEIEAENQRRREAAEREAEGLDGLTLVLVRQASNTGALYGSVTSRDIVEALAAEGRRVSRSAIVLDRPIKTLGMVEVRVALHPEVAPVIRINVARSAEEAELQAQGIDPVAAEREAEAAEAEAQRAAFVGRAAPPEDGTDEAADEAKDGADDTAADGVERDEAVQPTAS